VLVGVLWHLCGSMPIQSCSPGYQRSNLAATARQWVLVAPIDVEDGGEDVGLGLERWVRLVEGLLDGVGKLVEVAQIVVLLEAVEPGCAIGEEHQIVDVGVVRLRGLRQHPDGQERAIIAEDLADIEAHTRPGRHCRP
jgi:hypothetical protein